MTDYTPTTEEVREAYVIDDECVFMTSKAQWTAEEFDRWLADVKAQAWEEGNKQAHQDIDGEWPTSYTPNPYRQGEN